MIIEIPVQSLQHLKLDIQVNLCVSKAYFLMSPSLLSNMQTNGLYS